MTIFINSKVGNMKYLVIVTLIILSGLPLWCGEDIIDKTKEAERIKKGINSYIDSHQDFYVNLINNHQDLVFDKIDLQTTKEIKIDSSRGAYLICHRLEFKGAKVFKLRKSICYIAGDPFSDTLNMGNIAGICDMISSVIYSDEKSYSLYSLLEITIDTLATLVDFVDPNSNKRYYAYFKTDSLGQYFSEIYKAFDQKHDYGIFSEVNYINTFAGFCANYWDDAKYFEDITELTSKNHLFILRDNWLILFKNKIYSQECLEAQFPHKSISEILLNYENVISDCDIDIHFKIRPDELEQIKNME
jgi:hypothetical protein